MRIYSEDSEIIASRTPSNERRPSLRAIGEFQEREGYKRGLENRKPEDSSDLSALARKSEGGNASNLRLKNVKSYPSYKSDKSLYALKVVRGPDYGGHLTHK
ncbi:MAG: hypothetical protein EBZ48_13575 [Proteobacteria bacterium]|nr:hypothetical protein [Pseudomonadota bacterium]